MGLNIIRLDAEHHCTGIQLTFCCSKALLTGEHVWCKHQDNISEWFKCTDEFNGIAKNRWDEKGEMLMMWAKNGKTRMV